MRFEKPIPEELFTTQIDIDYYAILGLSTTATSSEIRAMYIKLSKKYHPDKNKDIDACTRFAEVADAASVLCSEKLKEDYDRERAIRQQYRTTPAAGGAAEYAAHGDTGRWYYNDFRSKSSVPPTDENEPPTFVRPPSPTTDGLGNGRYDEYGWDARIQRHEDVPHPDYLRELEWEQRITDCEHLLKRLEAEGDEDLRADGYYGRADRYEC